MKKIDLKKELGPLYRVPKGRVVEVEVPPLRYLMIDGQGNPNTSQAYADAVEALFSVSYTAKFMVKKGPQAIDYAVMPLEGLWWADDMTSFTVEDKARWKWTMMILQPDFVPEEVIADALAHVQRKKHLPAVGPTPENGRMNVSDKMGRMLNELEKAHIYIERLHKENQRLLARLEEQEERRKAATADQVDRNTLLSDRLARIEKLLGQ